MTLTWRWIAKRLPLTKRAAFFFVVAVWCCFNADATSAGVKFIGVPLALAP
ncbi:MAG: hypothetical protein H7346_22375 [Burkholderiaceae bacterium]|nr:hypothetical protein [Burkholderiaceae bacterium]